MAIGPRNDDRLDVDDEFNAVLVSMSWDRKIDVIKLLREVTGLGLREAKDFVEHLPRAVKEDVLPEDGEALVRRFSALGAHLEVWPSSRPLPG